MSIATTNICRGILAIGRELHFPLDISLNTFLRLTQNNGQAALYYLKLTDSSRYFSYSILKSLSKHRHTDHNECINIYINLVILKPGDIIMTRTAIQSDKKERKL